MTKRIYRNPRLAIAASDLVAPGRLARFARKLSRAFARFLKLLLL